MMGNGDSDKRESCSIEENWVSGEDSARLFFDVLYVIVT